MAPHIWHLIGTSPRHLIFGTSHLAPHIWYHGTTHLGTTYPSQSYQSWHHRVWHHTFGHLTSLAPHVTCISQSEARDGARWPPSAVPHVPHVPHIWHLIAPHGTSAPHWHLTFDTSPRHHIFGTTDLAPHIWHHGTTYLAPHGTTHIGTTHLALTIEGTFVFTNRKILKLGATEIILYSSMAQLSEIT